MSTDSWRPPLAIAHRGSRFLWPENTMEAFSQAVSLGYRYLETDLHLTSDGVLVCIHDPTLDRTTDGSGRVSAHSWSEISRLDAGFRHAAGDGYQYRGKGLRVPSLEELANTFPEASLVVDLKSEDLVEPLAALIERLDLHDRLIVGSFADHRVAAFRAVTRGRVRVSAGPTLVRRWLLASRLGRGVRSEIAALQIPRSSRGIRVADRHMVSAAHNHGIQVHVWTVNRPEEMHELLELGVDGLVTDRPDLLKEVLEERGEWG